MKRLTVLLLSVIFASFVFAPRAEVRSQRVGKAKPRYAERQIIVKLRTEAKPSVSEVQAIDSSQLAQMVLPNEGTRADAVESGAPGESGIYVVHLADGVSVEGALQRALTDPRVEYAEPDYEIHEARIPEDPFFDELWGLLNTGTFGAPGADIGATSAWDLTTGSDDVVVAVTDKGVVDHPDLAANLWINPREIPGNGIDDDNNNLIDDVRGWNFVDNNNNLTDPPRSHGTHVAGTIGAVGSNGVGITGVAWHVKLMSLQFLGTVPGTTSNAVKCIKYAIDQKKRGVNVRVINASWGGSGDSQSLHDTIAEAGREGIVFVCAAGNGVEVEGIGDDVDEVPDYPAFWAADLPSVISVAALDKGDFLPGFSNYGHRTVTVAAPGVLIKSTVPGDYGFLSGTSMSAPHVSGIVALLASYSPSLTPEQIKNRIIRTAVPVLSLASKAVASGRANAFNALTNNVAAVGSVGINRVQTNKKFVYVDGLNFKSGTSVVEVNGVPLPKTKGDAGYAIGNDTVTRLFVKLGKPGVKSTFPQFTQVFVTVFNPETGERSQPKGFTRF